MQILIILATLRIFCCVAGFGVIQPPKNSQLFQRQRAGLCLWDAPPATSSSTDVAEVDIPKSLPSQVGKDYVPLATFLATGQLAEADQVSLQNH